MYLLFLLLREIENQRRNQTKSQLQMNRIPESKLDDLITNLQASSDVLSLGGGESIFFRGGGAIKERFILTKSQQGYELRTSIGPFRTGMLKVQFKTNSGGYALSPKVDRLLLFILIGLVSLSTSIILILDNCGLVSGAIFYFIIYVAVLFTLIFLMLWREHRELKRFIYQMSNR